MNACADPGTGHHFDFHGAVLTALAGGALFWREAALLCVTDLHFGKALRSARTGGAPLPPYEVRETLARLDADIAATGARTVVCLGDSFDDPGAEDRLAADDRLWLLRLMAGRRWIWIAGNHDPAPLDLGGEHRRDWQHGPLVFRHAAETGARAEVSGHFHPKARLGLGGGSVSRPCFLIDRDRVILPAYGRYTGGLDCRAPVLAGLMGPGALAVLTGDRARVVPMPRAE
jgi:DNA ligase-associated metallophosphoesterase